MKFSRLISSTASALLLGLLACFAHAQTAADTPQTLQQRTQARDQERAAIAQGRQEIEARKQAAEKDCWQRFAVEDCLAKVRKAAREEEQPLRDRELRIHSDERQDKANERLRAIEQKQRGKQAPAPTVMRARDAEPEVELTEAQHASQAQQRAAVQAQRLQTHEAEVARKQAQQEQERLEALQAQQAKQATAEARRASKTQAVARQKGAPLPTPAELPQP